MHRIAGYGKYEIATGIYGFYNGDPANLIPRTIIEDDWLNAIQEEIAECIEKQGGTLNSATEAVSDMKQLNNAVGQSWVTFTVGAAGALTELDSRNLASSGGLTRQSAGVYRVKWENAYADSNYCVLASVADGSNSIWCTVDVVDQDEVEIRVFDSSGAYETTADTLRLNVRATGSM